MKNPFTHTPGMVGDSNIVTKKEEIIYNNFLYDVPSESVYKITGIRGSGKTVIFGNVIRHYKTEAMKKEGWLSYDLSSARNLIRTLLSYMSLEDEVKPLVMKDKSSLTVSVPFVSAGMEMKDNDIDEEVRLEQLLSVLIRSGKKILIGIDDIAKTKPVTEFCSVYAKLIRNTVSDLDNRPWPLYLICSGVYHNFHELGESKNLTFFKRSAEVKTEPFGLASMAVKYENSLGIEEEKAIELAKLTNGFAYAYQVIGSAYFENSGSSLDHILKLAKGELFSQCYEKIWSELPDGERGILRILSHGPKKRSEVIAEMNKGNNYQVYSNNLKKMGLLKSSDEAYGRAEITLPFFGEFIDKYC